MKITLISFDFWHYDAHIVSALKSLGVDAHHINLGAYSHKNSFARVQNAMSKLFLKRNLKNIKRHELLVSELKKRGPQDQILVINPEMISTEHHQFIKTFTSRYIAYLYDSLARCPAEHLLQFFDKIFSFDKDDAERHDFQLITNYNYLPERKIPTQFQFDLVYLASFDKRISMAEDIAKKMEAIKKTYHYLLIGKKSWKEKYLGSKNFNWSFSRKKLEHDAIPNFYAQGKVILDLARDNQSGLSFRIFEAMALKQKVITNNDTVNIYEFYNPSNILMVNQDLSNITPSFFETDYQELDPKIYYKYTVENWVKTVFELQDS